MIWILIGVGIAAALAYRASAAHATTVPAPTPPDPPAPPPEQPAPPSPPESPPTPPRVETSAFPRGPDIKISLGDAGIRAWNGAVHQVMPLHGIPPLYGLAWLGVESGGNACAVGGKTATGPDGYPREQNLFQFYNPDDLKALGITSADLCGFCVRPAVGAKKRPAAEGGYYDGTLPNPQQLLHPLDSAEMIKQVEYGAGLIKLKRAAADRHLQANGVTWPATSPDYWAAVKCPHAWPAILAIGLPRVTKHLGRAPASWAEFRSTYEQIDPDARYNPALAEQSATFRSLRNCEWVGFHVKDAPSP